VQPTPQDQQSTMAPPNADAPAHNAVVVPLSATFQAQCPCTWSGHARSKRDVAAMDAATHNRDGNAPVTHADRDYAADQSEQAQRSNRERIAWSRY
jgi:hypothetical protein